MFAKLSGNMTRSLSVNLSLHRQFQFLLHSCPLSSSGHLQDIHQLQQRFLLSLLRDFSYCTLHPRDCANTVIYLRESSWWSLWLRMTQNSYGLLSQDINPAAVSEGRKGSRCTRVQHIFMHSEYHDVFVIPRCQGHTPITSMQMFCSGSPVLSSSAGTDRHLNVITPASPRGATYGVRVPITFRGTWSPFQIAFFTGQHQSTGQTSLLLSRIVEEPVPTFSPGYSCRG